MTAADALRAEASRRILIKDGAYGTLIQAEKLKSEDYCAGLDLMKDQRGNNDLLNLTQPDIVRAICARFADSETVGLSSSTAAAPSASSGVAEFAFTVMIGVPWVTFAVTV